MMKKVASAIQKGRLGQICSQSITVTVAVCCVTTDECLSHITSKLIDIFTQLQLSMF